jgi:hypothetical protein
MHLTSMHTQPSASGTCCLNRAAKNECCAHHVHCQFLVTHWYCTSEGLSNKHLQIAKIRETFDLIDLDGSGEVTRFEFRRYMAQVERRYIFVRTLYHQYVSDSCRYSTSC